MTSVKYEADISEAGGWLRPLDQVVVYFNADVSIRCLRVNL
jgi:hypothetical protein